MKRHAAALLLALVLVPALAVAGENAPAGADRKDWIPLFNGKSLEGWVPKITGYDVGDNFGNTFRVENGVLKVPYDQYDDASGAGSATSSTRRPSRTTGSWSSTASWASRRRTARTGPSATAAP